ncbi:Aldo keto reductase [Fusarium beomiforme]|uniref:Aldo keto reductase n=1 Tax=Fusarium beomiforme TaxID=44412 RepID=A0A9P5DY14_9HYPO|nr:Aldo keto reductase [Fusarium beomiforme]
MDFFSEVIAKPQPKLQHSGHRRYNVALVGLGHRGYRTFFKCLQSASFNMVSVCDTDSNKTIIFSQSHPDVPVYSSIEAMLADCKPDFAIVCVPHQYHKGCVDILANSGVPVLKEKPVAESAEDFRKLVCVPIKIGVTMQKRFEPRYIQFKSLLSLVGEIASIQARIVLNVQDLASSWRASQGVGVTEDLGCHILDILVWMLGKPDSLMASRVISVRSPPDCKGDDVSIIAMRWPSNAVGYVYISRIGPFAEESLVVTGTKGTLALHDHKITHSDLDGNQTFEVNNDHRKESTIQSMCHAFGDYVTGRTGDYKGALTGFADTMATIEAVNRSFMTFRVEKVCPIVSNLHTMITNGDHGANGLANGTSKHPVVVCNGNTHPQNGTDAPLSPPPTTLKMFTLNTGARLPAVGLGTRKPKAPGQVCRAVKTALAAGYRHIDTAFSYRNEHEVGQAIKESGIPRSDIWITTKLDNKWHNRVEEAFTESLNALGVEYVDLYLMHWPVSLDPEDPEKQLTEWNFINTWQEMQRIAKSGRAKAIGVSNFGISDLKTLLDSPSCTITPAVNQIEMHPHWQTNKLLSYCQSKGIHCMAYSPLASQDSALYDEPRLSQIAASKGKTRQQILIMWGLQRGTSVIPKSVTDSRIVENFELDGWWLTNDEMAKLNSLGTRHKVYSDDWLPRKVFHEEDA